MYHKDVILHLNAEKSIRKSWSLYNFSLQCITPPLNHHPPSRPPPPSPGKVYFSAAANLISIVKQNRQPQHKLVTKKLVGSKLKLAWAWHSSAPACYWSKPILLLTQWKFDFTGTSQLELSLAIQNMQYMIRDKEKDIGTSWGWAVPSSGQLKLATH